MSTLSLKQLFEERKALDNWLYQCGWFEMGMRHSESESDREKSARALDRLKKNYRFRFCRPETDTIKETIDNTFLEAQSIDSKLRLESAWLHIDHSATDYLREQVITRRSGLLKRKKLLALVQDKSFFRNRYFTHIGFYPESEIETTIDLPELFVKNLSIKIQHLNEEREAFEDEHRYDYEHEERWLYPQRVIMYDSDFFNRFKKVEPYSRKLLVLLEDGLD